MMPPRIAVTSGEPAGIGPELCLRLAAYDGPAQPVILGDRDLLAERARAIGLNVHFRDLLLITCPMTSLRLLYSKPVKLRCNSPFLVASLLLAGQPSLRQVIAQIESALCSTPRSWRRSLRLQPDGQLAQHLVGQLDVPHQAAVVAGTRQERSGELRPSLQRVGDSEHLLEGRERRLTG